MTPAEFIAKWERVTLKESAADREHFLDLCRLVGHETPAEGDPEGVRFTFQKGLRKAGGGQGYADVWKRGFFAWEYKDKRHKDLDAAYAQLKFYTTDLENPPLLVVCDLDRFVIHTEFNNTPHEVRAFRTRDLDRPEILAMLRAVFTDPEALRPGQVLETITTEAAARLAALAEKMERRGVGPERAAHFLMQCVFCMFAEDVGLLPDALFTEILTKSQGKPDQFRKYAEALFRSMATGGEVLMREVRHFNGGLFETVDIPDPDGTEIMNLAMAARMDWRSVEPAVFGTLFERSLDPSKRRQQGAHYTGRDDIMLAVEPVVMEPLREEWAALRAEVEAAIPEGGPDAEAAEAGRRLQDFVDRLGRLRILDPACGSGNFLYVSLFGLLDLEKEARDFAVRRSLPYVEARVGPHQLFGIEVNPYAHQLAQLVVWIGFLQWKHFHGEPVSDPPILKPLDNIRHMDAILDRSGDAPRIPDWPEADVLIGNPPFLGGNRIRQHLKDEYVDALFRCYEGAVPPFSDLVCYWFERARAQIAAGRAKRAGLLATNSIRGGANRRVLERIRESGDIFAAWADRAWVLDGAAVRISIVGFDDGSQTERTLDGAPVPSINADLTAAVDITQAKVLPENLGISYQGPSPKAPFDIGPEVAEPMLRAPLNVNGRPNSDVVRPVLNARDMMQQNRGWYTIDFGTDMKQDEAAEYELPFEYVQTHVYPVRQQNNRPRYRELWWLYAEARPGLRKAICRLKRVIVTPRVAKHRVFIWVPCDTLANDSTIVFARDDDYTFGVLHSRAHEVWSLRMGTALEDRPRYTPTTCFETFPFPRADEAQRAAIAEAARALNAARETARANDPNLTLTALYNKRPTWLANLHAALDRAVYDAYGWADDPTEGQILERLLALNLERAGECAAQGAE